MRSGRTTRRDGGVRASFPAPAPLLCYHYFILEEINLSWVHCKDPSLHNAGFNRITTNSYMLFALF